MSRLLAIAALAAAATPCAALAQPTAAALRDAAFAAGAVKTDFPRYQLKLATERPVEAEGMRLQSPGTSGTPDAPDDGFSVFAASKRKSLDLNPFGDGLTSAQGMQGAAAQAGLGYRNGGLAASLGYTRRQMKAVQELSNGRSTLVKDDMVGLSVSFRPKR